MKTIPLAASLLFAAVALGAFGAHALREQLAQREMAHAWDTAVLFHLVHGVALLVIGVWRRNDSRADRAATVKAAVVLLTAGIICFSGSLYALGLGAPRWIGRVTPLGGLAFLAAWLVLAIGSARFPRSETDSG